MIEALKQFLLRLKESGQNSTLWLITPQSLTLDIAAATVVLASYFKHHGISVSVVSPFVIEQAVNRFLPEFARLAHPSLLFGVDVFIETDNHQPQQIETKQSGNRITLTIPGTREVSFRGVKPWQTTPDNSVILEIPSRVMLERSHPTLASSIKQSPTTLLATTVEAEPWCDLSIVEPKTSGVSELVARAMLAVDPDSIGKEEATSLYLGIIQSTRGFSTRNHFPQTFEVAASLIERGANHARLIESLYHSKELKELKLWGRALARLERDAHRNIVWTHVPASDFERTGTSPENARGVLDELIADASGNDVAILSLELAPNRVEVNITCSHFGFQLADLFWKYSPLGDNTRITFIVSKSLLETEHEVLDLLISHADKLRRR